MVQFSKEKYILEGGDYERVYTESSYGELIIRNLALGTNTPALIDAFTDEVLTYDVILTKVLKLAEYFRSINLVKGDVISICSENQLQFGIPILAALALGIIVAPLNAMYTENELKHALNISKPTIIFCSDITKDHIYDAVQSESFVKKIIVFGSPDIPDTTSTFTFLDEIFNTQPNISLANFKFTPIDTREDVAIIFCSSGTTGLPKGVMLTHHNLIYCFATLADTRIGILQHGDVELLFLPLFHGYGCMVLLQALGMRVKTVIMPMFSEELFFSMIQKHKITITTIVPPLCVLMAKSSIIDSYDLTSLRRLICGAAALSKELSDEVEARLKRKNIITQAYGLTEITLGVLFQPINDIRAGGVGTLTPGVKAKVIDTETGEILGPNKAGELCFKGDMIMKGYRNDPKSTNDTIDPDGWLHTGDVGYYDESGYFYIVDRVKELIKYKGFQVPPAELEALILQIKDVKDVAVIGVPDEAAGEKALAFVVKQPDAKISEKDIIKYVAERVSPPKRLHGGVRFIEEIPKNLSGKILRRVLRDLLKNKSKL